MESKFVSPSGPFMLDSFTGRGPHATAQDAVELNQSSQSTSSSQVKLRSIFISSTVKSIHSGFGKFSI